MLKETEAEETICCVAIIFIISGISIGEGGQTPVLPSSSRIDFLVCQKFLQNLLFVMLLRVAGLPMAGGGGGCRWPTVTSRRGRLCTADYAPGNLEAWTFGVFSSSSHFLNKTDFEQYLSL